MKEAQKHHKELKEVVNVFLSKASSQSDEVSQSKIHSSALAHSQVISFFMPFQDQKTFMLNSMFAAYLSTSYEKCFFCTHLLPHQEKEIICQYAGVPQEKLYGWSQNQSSVDFSSQFSWIGLRDRKFFEKKIPSPHFESTPRDIEPPFLIVLDLYRSAVLGYEYLIRTLDHLILVVTPDIEDLKNAYKVIKACHYINNQLKISVLFQSTLTQTQVEKVFSEFYAIVSQFLAISIQCLGSFDFDGSRGEESLNERKIKDLSLDSLIEPYSRETDMGKGSLEQMRFLQKLDVLISEHKGKT